MSDRSTELLPEHVERWRRTARALEAIEIEELRKLDTREVVAQLFGDNTLVQDAPRLTTSGLVEQQRWFTKIYKKLHGDRE